MKTTLPALLALALAAASALAERPTNSTPLGHVDPAPNGPEYAQPTDCHDDDHFQTSNSTGESLTVFTVACDGQSSDVETQPSHTTWYWKSDDHCGKNECFDYTNPDNGWVRDCRGCPIPCQITVCAQSGACVTVRDCPIQRSDPMPGSAGSDHKREILAVSYDRMWRALREKERHVVITDETIASLEDIREEYPAAEYPDSRIYLMYAGEYVNGEWIAKEMFALSFEKGADIHETIDSNGRHIEAPVIYENVLSDVRPRND